MAEGYSVSELAKRIGSLEVDLKGISTTQALNHKQNRDDIHAIKNGQQNILDKMEEIKDKVKAIEFNKAKWNIIAGVATAIALKALDHFFRS